MVRQMMGRHLLVIPNNSSSSSNSNNLEGQMFIMIMVRFMISLSPNHLWLTMMMKKECRCVTEDNMIGERSMG